MKIGTNLFALRVQISSRLSCGAWQDRLSIIIAAELFPLSISFSFFLIFLRRLFALPRENYFVCSNCFSRSKNKTEFRLSVSFTSLQVTGENDALYVLSNSIQVLEWDWNFVLCAVQWRSCFPLAVSWLNDQVVCIFFRLYSVWVGSWAMSSLDGWRARVLWPCKCVWVFRRVLDAARSQHTFIYILSTSTRHSLNTVAMRSILSFSLYQTTCHCVGIDATIVCWDIRRQLRLGGRVSEPTSWTWPDRRTCSCSATTTPWAYHSSVTAAYPKTNCDKHRPPHRESMKYENETWA